MKSTFGCLAVAMLGWVMLPTANAQQAGVPAGDEWQGLPRNTTIYVPVPRQVTPVSAYSACSNRYEGDSCDFSTSSQGVVEGSCQAPELRRPPAYGYEQRQYPEQVRTALVCRPKQEPPPSGDTLESLPPPDPNNPGREMPYPPSSTEQR